MNKAKQNKKQTFKGDLLNQVFADLEEIERNLQKDLKTARERAFQRRKLTQQEKDSKQLEALRKKILPASL